jgi:hypothetical protein
VIELTCDEVRESAAEFALDILPSGVRSAVAAHMLRCPACREEIDEMEKIGWRLLDVVPGTEPPLGFDRRVLARVQPERPRRRFVRAAITVAAAAVIAVAATIGAVDTGRSSHAGRTILASAILQNGSRQIGEVYVYAGKPPWIGMSIKSVTVKGKVICEIIGMDGKVTKLGSFPVVHGGGSWFAPDPAASAGLVGVRLVDSSGQTVAAGDFS